LAAIVLKNDSELILRAVPYAKDGRIMVPLRFVAGAFDCQVNYVDGKVYIATPPLYIDGKKVVSLQSRMRMTMGGIIDECKNNYYINRFFQMLNSGQWQETVAPDYYGAQLNLDIPFFYYLEGQYSFMESTGVDGSIIQQFHTYKCMNDWGEGNQLAVAIGTDQGDWLLYDVNHNKWYKINWDDYQKELGNIPAGAWQKILNDVV
jgi:hypothetical protein